MKDNKITIVFDEEDTKKFLEISNRFGWTDKRIITIALRNFYEKFKKNWKILIVESLESEKK
ncbi:MAG: hypothetical protein ABIE55_01110 [Candidatus Aenigmatarchaeota archaeon]